MKASRFNREIIDEYVKAGYWDTSLISDFWDRNARERPDAMALVEDDARITWAEAKRQIDCIAYSLLELGIKRDERVAVQLHNCTELLTFRLACEKAGIIAVTLLPNFRETEVAGILAHTGAKGIVVPGEFRNFDYIGMVQGIRPRLPELKYLFVTGGDVPEGVISVKAMANRPIDDRRAELPALFKERRFSAFETFQIATTTGTTGMPKCVEFASSVRQLTGRVIAKRLMITKDDVVGAFAPVIAGGCFNEVYRASPMVGARIVLAKYFTPEEILSFIETEKVTVIATVPAVLIRVLDHPDFEKYDVSSIRIVKYGGAALPYDQGVKVWGRFKKPGLPAYGGLDVGTISSSFVGDAKEHLLATVGKPLDGVVIKLVDEDSREVGEGEIGEVLVKGPHCEPGYYNDPGATSEAWQGGWFRTGDLGSFDGEGRLTIRGRRKDMILRGGQNIYPLEIETMLLKHPCVGKTAVIGMPDAEMGERACAYVVPKEGEKFSFTDMVSFMKSQAVAPFKIPERLELVDDLPLAGGIKVDKKQLRLDIETKLRHEGKDGK
jgi:non-ribosomal peptide synthetase component E (peptide arylation enzyme)